ncbi:hypothetical protein HAZT_HAZT011408 [Hyalella azteca]|uniref:C2H2-type domain-containing protein n=1 Tax=Hyalella azteca TaxID=294128 RepID=A0A6A0HID9_HYAAZ|nr:hypothetical protein HAZT_HAZT011408 [Hyalella azteca]
MDEADTLSIVVMAEADSLNIVGMDDADSLNIVGMAEADSALSKQLGIDLKSPEHSILVRRSAGFRSNDHLLTKSTSESHVSAEDTKSDLDFSDESQPLDLSCRRDVLLDGKKLLPATVNGLLADEIGSIHYSMNISTPKSMCSHSLLEAVLSSRLLCIDHRSGCRPFDSEKLPSRDGDELALDKSCRGSFKHEPEERRSPFLSPDDDSDVTVAQMLTALRRGSLTRQYFPENLTNVTTCNMLTRNGIITCRASSPVTNLQNFESLSSYAAGGHASKSLKKLSSPCIEIPNKYRELPDADKPISHSPPSLISASQCSDSQCSGSINYTESDYVSSSEGTGVFCIKTEVQDVVTAHDVLKLREENVIAGLVNGADVSKNLTAFAVLSQADTLPVTKTHAVNYPKLKLKNGAISANGKEKHASMEGENVFKMYQCRYCEKKFDRAFSCNRHERVHTGYKPCYCKHCGKGFSEPRNLRHHMIRFHSDGSMKHLIRRDRRRRLSGEYGMMPLSKPAGVLYSPGVFQNPVSSGFSFKNGIAENIAMKAFSDNGLKNFLQLIEPLQQKSLAMNDIVNSNVGDVKMQPCVQSLLGSNADTKPQQIFAKAGVNLLLKSQLPFATLLSDVPTSPVDLTRVTDLIRSDADTNYDSEYSLGYSSINSEANVCRQVPTSASDTVSEDDKLEAPTNQLCDGLDDDQPSIRDADIHVIDENERVRQVKVSGNRCSSRFTAPRRSLRMSQREMRRFTTAIFVAILLAQRVNCGFISSGTKVNIA